MNKNAPSLSLLEAASLGAALAAADSHGLLRALAEGPDTAAGFARRLGLEEGAARATLEVLRASGFADFLPAENCYAASEALRRDLVSFPGPPGMATAIFAGAPHWLRTGESVNARSETAETRGKIYPPVVSALADLFQEPARRLAEELSPLPCDHILEVGAGSGHWGLAQLRLRPETRLTFLDLPEVTPIPLRRAADLGLSQRVDAIAGDYHTVALPEKVFDRILLAGMLHLEPAEKAEALLKRLAPALRPGGHFVIVDSMASDTPERDRARSAYALFLALRIRGGTPHAEKILRAWLGELGHGARRLDLDDPVPSLCALISVPIS